MSTSPSGPVTQLLRAAAEGDTAAVNHLWATVYAELRRMAQAQLNCEGPHCSLQTTSLINEAYLRLVGNGPVEWANRRHFFGAAAEAMRRILVDDARKRGRIKHGADWQQVPLPVDPPAADGNPILSLAVDEAIQRLKQVDARKYEVVMLRYFAGLSVDETAAAMALSVRTIAEEWRFAKAWLHRELAKGDSAGG